MNSAIIHAFTLLGLCWLVGSSIVLLIGYLLDRGELESLDEECAGWN